MSTSATTMKTDHHPQRQEDHPKNDSTSSIGGGTINQKKTKDKNTELLYSGDDDDDQNNIKWETVPNFDEGTNQEQQRRNASTSRGRNRQTQQQQRRRRHVTVQQTSKSQPQKQQRQRLDLTSPICIAIRFSKHCLHQFYTNPYFMLGYVLLLSGLCVNALSTLWMCLSWMYTLLTNPRIWLFGWIPIITSCLYFIHQQKTQRNDDTTQSLLLNSPDNSSTMVRHFHNNDQNRRRVVASSSSSAATATTTTATTSSNVTPLTMNNIDDVLVKCVHLVGGILYLLPVLLDIHTLWIVRDTICRGLDPCQLITYVCIMCIYLFWSQISGAGAGAGAEAPSIVVLWSQQVKQCQLLLHILALHGAFQWLRRSSCSDDDDITTTLWNIMHVLALVLMFVGSCLISIRHWYVVCFEEHQNNSDDNYVVSYLSKEEWMNECLRYGLRMTLRDILTEISDGQREYLQTLGGTAAADDVDQSLLLELAMLRWIVDYWGHTTSSTRGPSNTTSTSGAAGNAEHSSSLRDDNDVALQQEEEMKNDDDDAFGWDEMRAMLSTTTDIMTQEEKEHDMMETTTSRNHHEQTDKWMPLTSTTATTSTTTTTTNPASTTAATMTGGVPQNNSKPTNDQPPQQSLTSSVHSSTLFSQLLSSLDNVDEHARPAIMTYKSLVEKKLLPRRDVAIAIKFISHIPATLSLCLFLIWGGSNSIPTLWFLMGGMIVLMPLCILEWFTFNQWMEQACRHQPEHCRHTVVDNDPITTKTNNNNNEDEDDSVSNSSATMNKLWSTTFLHDIVSLVCPSFDYDVIYNQMDVMSILFTSVVIRKVDQKQPVMNDTNGASTTRQQQRGQPRQTLVQLHLKRHTLFNVYRNLQYSVRALEGGLMVTRAIQTTALAMEFANSLYTLSHLTKEVYEYGWLHGLSLVLREYVHYRTTSEEQNQRSRLLDHQHPFHRSSTSSLFNDENNVRPQVLLPLEDGPRATKRGLLEDDVKEECSTLPNVSDSLMREEENSAPTAPSTNNSSLSLITTTTTTTTNNNNTKTLANETDETAAAADASKDDDKAHQQGKNNSIITNKVSTSETSCRGNTTLVVPPATPMAQPGEYAMAAQSAIQHGTSLMNNVQKLHEEHPHLWNTVVKASEPVGNVALSAVGRGWLWGKDEDEQKRNTQISSSSNHQVKTINDKDDDDDTTAAAKNDGGADTDAATKTIIVKDDDNETEHSSEVEEARAEEEGTTTMIEQQQKFQANVEKTIAISTVATNDVKAASKHNTMKSDEEGQNEEERITLRSNKEEDEGDDADDDNDVSPKTVCVKERATVTTTTTKQESGTITTAESKNATMKKENSPSINIGHGAGGAVTSLMMKVVASTITRSSSNKTSATTSTADEEKDITMMKDGTTIINETHFEADKHKVSSSLEEDDALALPQTMLLVPTNETLDRYIVNDKDSTTTDMVYNPSLCDTKKMAVNDATTSSTDATNKHCNEHQKTHDHKETLSSTSQAKKQETIAKDDEDEEDKWMYIDHKRVGTSSSAASHHSIFSSSEDEEESLLYDDDELGDDDDNWLTLSAPTADAAGVSTNNATSKQGIRNTKQHAVIMDDGATGSSSTTSPHLSALSMASRLLSNATTHSSRSAATASSASHRGRGTTATTERDHCSTNNKTNTTGSNSSNAEWSKWVGGGLAVVGAALAGAVSIHGKLVEEERLATQHQVLGPGSGVQIEELPNDDVVDDDEDDEGTGTVVVRRSTSTVKANKRDDDPKNTTIH